MLNQHYDLIVIGTGAGGGTLIHQLAPSGKKILILERGSFLPQEKANWDSRSVIREERYRASERWYDTDGSTIQPASHYYVGGNTKVYGGALFRFREQDFQQVTHEGGISPEWTLSYQDFAPYYTQAEHLYEVHGKRGLDPTEPPTDSEYPFPAIAHEPDIQTIDCALKEQGLQPFHQPLAIKRNEQNPLMSACIRCDTCDGFPCLIQAKADADINGVRPAMSYSNLTLMTNAEVLRLDTSPSGREVTSVEAAIAGEHQRFTADIIVVACGAVKSALLLLNSANDRHPHGLANGSNLVGRNYMAHHHVVVMALSMKRNLARFQKTLAANDFYWGDGEFAYPLGSAQILGNVNKDRILAHAPPGIPEFVGEVIAQRSIAWLLITEDLPDANNRVYFDGKKVILDYTENNLVASNRLTHRWINTLKSIEPRDRIPHFSFYITRRISSDTAHQCGTCRFGTDPQMSVLDLNCRTHELDNLYVVDSSFFPSSAALNPSLTIMSNALRVGDHLLERLK